MSNGLISVVRGIGSFVSRWSVRIVKYGRHRLLTQRKSLLVIGERENPLYRSMFDVMNKNWEITLIHHTGEIVEEL